MKRAHYTTTLFILILLTISLIARSQAIQYSIGGKNNEIAVKLCFDPTDSSTILAGYSYDYKLKKVSNCFGLLLKVNKTGTIVWQKNFGIPGTNNLVQDMILTQDGNVVLVGKVGGTSANVYADNTAAIMKFNAQTGNLMWQKCFRNMNTTEGGELFLGVTELKDGTARLVAVGAHNFTNAGSGSMICVFQSNGTMIYNEVIDIISGDVFGGVTTSAAGNSVYICGEFVGDYKDARIIKYTPGTTSGVVNWSSQFDYFPSGPLNNNSLRRIYLAGSRLVISGSSIQGWGFNAGTVHNILTLNTSDGKDPDIYTIRNSNAMFGNSPAIAVLSDEHIFTVQSPASSYYDAFLSTTGTSTGTVLTEITNLSASSAKTPVKFKTLNNAQQSINDIQYHDHTLRWTGSTNPFTAGEFNNDIYFVIADASLGSVFCDTTHETVSITKELVWNVGPSSSTFSFTPTYVNIDTGTANLHIHVMCKDFPASVSNVSSASQRLEVFPNPADDFITVKSGQTTLRVDIYNTLGQVMYSKKEHTSGKTINIEQLSPGVYYIRANSQTLKFIKE